MKLTKTDKKTEDSVVDTLGHRYYPREFWAKIISNSFKELLNREIKRRTRVGGTFLTESNAAWIILDSTGPTLALRDMGNNLVVRICPCRSGNPATHPLLEYIRITGVYPYLYTVITEALKCS